MLLSWNYSVDQTNKNFLLLLLMIFTALCPSDFPYLFCTLGSFNYLFVLFVL